MHAVTLRRTAALVLALVALVGTTHAEYVLFDDLSDEILGPIGGQDDWMSSGGNNAVVVDPADALNQCLYVPSESSVLRKALATEGLDCPDSTSRMLFFRMRVANKQTFSVGLSPSSFPSEYSDFAPEIGMANSAPNLDLRVWDDDGDNYETLLQLTPDTWYNVWVRVDTAGNYCEIWLSDVPRAGATAEDKLAAADEGDTFEFRTGSASALLTFYIKTSGGSSGFGPIYFDDIYVETTSTLNLANPTAFAVGDVNCDGWVNNGDIDAFVFALSYPEQYPVEYPDCDIMLGDINGDGFVNNGDIDAFVGLLSSQ